MFSVNHRNETKVAFKSMQLLRIGLLLFLFIYSRLSTVVPVYLLPFIHGCYCLSTPVYPRFFLFIYSRLFTVVPVYPLPFIHGCSCLSTSVYSRLLLFIYSEPEFKVGLHQINHNYSNFLKLSSLT